MQSPAGSKTSRGLYRCKSSLRFLMLFFLRLPVILRVTFSTGGGLEMRSEGPQLSAG